MSERHWCNFYPGGVGRSWCPQRPVGRYRIEDLDKLGIATRVGRLCSFHRSWFRDMNYRLTSRPEPDGNQERLFGRAKGNDEQ